MGYFPIVFLLLVVPCCLSAQQTVIPTFDTITVEFEVWDTPYLLRSEILDTTRQGYEAYMTGNYLSFSGYAQEATRVMEQKIGEKGMDTARYQRFREEFRPIPAIPAILKDAEEHEITIVNEAHHEPRHRIFTRQLLQGLYDRGYRHFGMETLWRGAGTDSLDNQTSYPALQAGFYTRDPQFAALVAEAQRIGYRIFGYEASETGSPRLREIGQMKNIMSYRTAHPDDKLLLHVGYSHALEGELGGAWEKAMAQRLADTTGLDPFTIDQTAFREMSDTVQERYEYRHFAPAEVSLFVDEKGGHFNFDDEVRWFDRYIFHPRTSYRYGRPDYVYAFGQQPVTVAFDHIDTEGPWLVRAYATTDEMAQAVPRDVVEMDGSSETALALFPGEYRLLVTSADGQQRVATVRVE